MNEQKEILEQYMAVNNNPTLRWVAKDTSIQLSRVFRIMNESPMKLDEYLVFRKKIMEKMKLNQYFSVLAMECENKLSLSSIETLAQFMKRALKQKRIKNSNIKYIKSA